MKFSTIATTEEKIQEKVLKERVGEFKELLAWIEDKDELGLKVYWKKMEKVFRAIPKENEEIRRLKEEISKKSPEAAFYDQVEIGKKVQAALQDKKKKMEEKITSPLKKISCDFKRLEPYGDKMVMSAAFLVEKSRQEEFEKALYKLQRGVGKGTDFKLITTAPPCNFVNIVIEFKEDSKTNAKEETHVSPG